MHGGDHQTAPGAMLGDKLGHQRPALGVEGGHRLIKQPDRAWFNQQPGQRKPALLAGRQAAPRHRFARSQPHPLHRRLGRSRLPTEIARPETRLFTRRFGRLCRVEMSQIVQSGVLARPVQLHGSGMSPGQSRENAKQGRLSRAIGAAQFHGFARRHPDRQAFEQNSQASRGCEILNLQDQG